MHIIIIRTLVGGGIFSRHLRKHHGRHHPHNPLDQDNPSSTSPPLTPPQLLSRGCHIHSHSQSQSLSLNLNHSQSNSNSNSNSRSGSVRLADGGVGNDNDIDDICSRTPSPPPPSPPIALQSHPYPTSQSHPYITSLVPEGESSQYGAINNAPPSSSPSPSSSSLSASNARVLRTSPHSY